jgi:hypothetical protein
MSSCGCGEKKQMYVELLAIDMSTCERCVPTGQEVRKAIETVRPVAEAMGKEIIYIEKVVSSADEAIMLGLQSSPTIRINGMDIEQDIEESKCASCSDIADGTPVDCREWHYKGKVYFHPPVQMLTEAITAELLKSDSKYIETKPLSELPENLVKFFKTRKRQNGTGCC